MITNMFPWFLDESCGHDCLHGLTWESEEPHNVLMSTCAFFFCLMMNDVNMQLTFCEAERVLDAQYTFVIAHVLVALYMRGMITSWLSCIFYFS